MTDSLYALSPLDGRYRSEVEALSDHFSDFAYLRARVRIEIAYFLALSQDLHLLRELQPGEVDFLRSLGETFCEADANEIQDFERITRHDVKAIEMFLRARFATTPLADTVSWIHFGLTSEDVNNIAQALALHQAREHILLPMLEAIAVLLEGLARQHKATPMLARTHGQAAVPTTFGKEMAVFLVRLRKGLQTLREHRFEAKLSGAVGNFNALTLAYPQVDWLAFSQRFIRHLGLQPNEMTTQTLPYDNWIAFFDNLRRVNSALLDLTQDLWHYTSRNYLRLRVIGAEVGSSTMPQKVNPIDFENAEGNLGLSNALLEHYSRKLPISRLQRDLSDSTVRRTFGTAWGHALTAYASLRRGLERVEVDEAALRSELDAHWETLAEGAQTLLRAEGQAEAYDLLKSLTRGQEWNRDRYLRWVEQLQASEETKARLRVLTPSSYLGLAERLAEEGAKAKLEE